MNEPKIENDDSEIIEEVIETPADDASDEDKAAHIEKLDKQNKQLYARMKKAEGFELVGDKWVKKEKPIEHKEPKVEKKESLQKDKMTHTDMIAVIKADIADEDLDEVIDYANLKKISVREALATPLIKGMIAEKAEQRKVAEGTNTDGSKRGNARISDEQLVANADKGIMPESDEDIARLTRIGLGLKK